MAFDINKWYSEHRTGDIIIEYKGVVSPDKISNLLDVAESKLDEISTPSKIRKKIYNALVEALQNLYHHACKDVVEGQEAPFGVALLTRHDAGFKLICGNYTLASNEKMLRDRLDQINSLSKDELKQLYKMILNNKEFSEKGGGGLGMIDIARKLNQNLNYKFYPINDKYIFYEFSVDIN